MSAATAEPRATAPRTSLPLVPDLNGRRYCKLCEATLPVAAFPAGKRRYLCRQHLLDRHKRPARQQVRSDARRRQADLEQKRCYHDAKRVFAQPRVALLLRDIRELLAAGCNHGVCLVPVDPTRPLARDNVKAVSTSTRAKLLRAMREGGVEGYCAALRSQKVSRWLSQPKSARDCSPVPKVAGAREV